MLRSFFKKTNSYYNERAIKFYFQLAAIMFFMAVFIGACEKQEKLEKRNIDEIEITSSLTEDVLQSSMNAISIVREKASTKNGIIDISEDEALEILEPMIEDGYNIRDQLLSIANEYPEEFSKEDIFAIKNMNDETATAFSLLLYYAKTFETTHLTKANDIKWIDVASCFWVLFGINNVKYLSVKGLLSATTLLQVAKAMLKRYCLGYLSLAFTAYEVYKCVQTRVVQSVDDR